MRSILFLFLAAILLAGSPGCSGGRAGVLIDPDAVGTDQGTLVSIGDIRTVAEEMIQSMNRNRQLDRLRAEKKPIRILVGDLKQRTSITIFDKSVFLNRLIARLNEADTAGSYSFLRRQSVAGERALQERGAVGTASGGGEVLSGADLVLNGEVREILHREAAPGGGAVEKRTVQYTLALDRVADGAVVWTDSREIVKQQILGALYQ